MTPEQAAGTFQFLLPTLEMEHATTKRVIAAIPADRSSYTPDAKSQSADSLAWHIAASEQMFLHLVATGEFLNPPRPDSVAAPADIVAWYEQQRAANLAAVKQLSGEQLARIVDFGGFFQLPAVAYLQFLLLHSSHHRGQLSAYLRPMGAKVPSIYGPSGDEGMPAPPK